MSGNPLGSFLGLDSQTNAAPEGGRRIAHFAANLGIHPEMLRSRVRQTEADSGTRTDLLTKEGARRDPGFCARRI